MQGSGGILTISLFKIEQMEIERIEFKAMSPPCSLAEAPMQALAANAASSAQVAISERTTRN
jgi:hypothetical protein